MSGPVTTQDRQAPPATTNKPAPPAADTGTPASSYGEMAKEGFKLPWGQGLTLTDTQLAKGSYTFTDAQQLLPGMTLISAELVNKKKELKVLGKLNIPLVEDTQIETRVKADGKVTIKGKGEAKAKVEIPALGSPEVTVAFDDAGQIVGTLEVSAMPLLPKSLDKKATAEGMGQLKVQTGKLSGSGTVKITYAGLGSSEVNFKVKEDGGFTGDGSVKITPPFMNEVTAKISIDEARNLTASANIPLQGTASPIPGLTLSGGTLALGYSNATPSAEFADFKASFGEFADVSLETLSISDGAFAGAGTISLALEELGDATGTVNVANNVVSGSLTVSSKVFPKGLVEGGSIKATLSEAGKIALSGGLNVKLGPVGKGMLTAGLDEAGAFSMGADVTLKVPGLTEAQVRISYADGKIEGEASVPIDTSLLPELGGDLTVKYTEGRWAGETTISYEADNGKLSGSITVSLAQNDNNALEFGGSGSVTAQVAPRLEGTLDATILPGAKGVDVSGEIVVTEPLELFPEKKLHKELFSLDQKIPLWGILVAVIGVNAGVRAGIGPGVFRNIKVEGSYTFGADAADPSLAISGELYIPAFVEGYVGIKAGLGLSVVLGSLTGGIEGVATAGLYGAISVVPELSYENGDWGIEGSATMAAGARLKLSLNAWAEVEALWITVWENSWPLTSWEAPIGPDLGLQADMAYKFGQPGPPTLTFDSSNVDTESLIQSAMPKDSPPKAGGSKKPDNQAEWKGPSKDKKKAPVPAEQQAKANKVEKPPQPKSPKPKGSGKGKRGKPEDQGKGGKALGSSKDAPGQKGAAAKPASPGGKGKGKDTQSPATKDAQAKGAHDAAKPDPSAKGAVPKDKAAQPEGPRYPKPITLATLDEPPALTPRTKEQEREDLKAAKTAIEQAKKAASDSADLSEYFAKIKKRFRLTSLGYEGDFAKGFKIVAKINPEVEASGHGEPIAGSGSPTGAKHKTQVKYATGSLGGDTVGKKMTASVLGPDHEEGSPPSGQDTLMGKLPTDPNKIKPKASKFIRGHLLNDNLGGPGKAKNMFPITSKANAEHVSQIEDRVKTWVNSKRFWVSYSVEVKYPNKLSSISSISGAKSPASDGATKYINAAFVCEASVLGLDLQPISGLTRRVTIQSQYEAEAKGTVAGTDADKVTTIKSAQNKHNKAAAAEKTLEEDTDKLDAHTARDEDHLIEVKTTSRHRSSKFPSEVSGDLDTAIADSSLANMKTKLLAAHGLGQRSVDLLIKAYQETKSGQITNLDGYDSNERRVLSTIFNGWKEKFSAALDG